MVAAEEAFHSLVHVLQPRLTVGDLDRLPGPLGIGIGAITVLNSAQE
jgi:hypothetical protein